MSPTRMSLSFGGFMIRRFVILAALFSLSGCAPTSQVAMMYINETAINAAYEMKKSNYHASIASNKTPQNISECISNVFRNYNDDGNYIYSDVKVSSLKGEQYDIIAKTPYNPKLVSPIADYNVNQILFLIEVQSHLNKASIDIWYNPDGFFGEEKIDLAKNLIQPCI